MTTPRSLSTTTRRTALAAVVITSTLLLSALLPEVALAGPGGKVASALFTTFWGKVLLFVLVLIFLPLIVLNIFKEQRAYRRAHRDLAFLTRYDQRFNWMNITARARDCYSRVHRAWANDDLSECADWMTEWYRDNQEATALAKWREKGLVNVCDMKEIKDVRPVLVSHAGHDDNHEGSMVVVEVKASMQDYLAEKETGVLVEGTKKYHDVTTLWTFILDDEQWRVNGIDSGDTLGSFIEQLKHIPKVETTVGTNIRA